MASARRHALSTRCSSPTCWNSVATRHDMDSTALALPRHQDNHVRGRRRQGRQADHLQPGAGGQGRGICRRRTRTSRCACTMRCGRSSKALPAAEEALRGDRAAAGAGAVRMEHRGVLVDRETAAGPEPRVRRPTAGADAAGAQGSWLGLQHRLPQAAPADPVRKAAAAGDAQDADRAAVDG